ncbi:MAG: PBP1A family penicillin-binding protein [Gemmatimonadota bacterium]|nr:PBP1A family penicillin-binding protein [Gemmatimonadota bacterium]
MRSLLRKCLTWRALGLVLVAALTASVSWRVFDARVARAFEIAEGRAPARVFARPLVLRTGDTPSIRRVTQQLERAGYRSTTGTPAAGEFRLRRREWEIGRRALRIGAFFDPGGPTTIRFDWSGRIREIRGGDGELAGIVLDPQQVAVFRGPDGRDRLPVRLEEIPPHLIDAILTTEDRRFLAHSGLDPRRIVGALVANLRDGSWTQGGSTVTQQLARTLFLNRDRTIMRKLREAAIASSLERSFPKERLLSAYLNHIYLGQNGAAAIHGVGRASQFFFGKDVTELTVDESAMIAGIIRGPSIYSPHRHPERAKARRDLVLRLMHQEGRLETAEFETALATDLAITPARRSPIGGRWYLDYLRSELGEIVGDGVGGSGLTVVATLEPTIQRAAERVVARQLARLEALRPRLAKQAQPLQAAVVAIDPWSGEVVAMVGGRSYARSQFNRATNARRQPGSAFKPIVALSALERSGGGHTLASVLADEPLEYETPSGVWSPSNSDREFHGPVSLRTALEESRNVPFARLGIEVGPERIVETARRLGVGSPLAPYPSLALGASEVTLLELTGAYAVLAAEGQRARPHSIRNVLTPDGASIDGVGDALSSDEFSAAEAYLVTSALRGVVENGTGAGVRELGYRGPVAAKSGTTNGSRDAWFVGYTPELAVGVWVGFDDGTPVGLTGSQAALPIFAEFLTAVLGPDGESDFRMPGGLEWRAVPAAGARGFECSGEPEIFLVGTAPRTPCYRWDRWRRNALGDDGLPDDVSRQLRARRRSGRGR